eukprot:3947992-Prymnesium_polylepis.1
MEFVECASKVCALEAGEDNKGTGRAGAWAMEPRAGQERWEEGQRSLATQRCSVRSSRGQRLTLIGRFGDKLGSS